MTQNYVQHLVYAVILVSVISGVVFYEFKQTQETRTVLIAELQKTQQTLDDKTTLIDQQLKQLQNNDKILDDALSAVRLDTSQLSTQLGEKGTQIDVLTGELDRVRKENAQQINQINNLISGLKTEFSDFSDVIDDVIPAVVSVQTNVGLGSGFFVDSRGYIVTNYHVVDGATAAVVETSSDDSYTVRIAGFHKNADIAVLKVENNNFPTLSFGDSDDVRVGEKVIAVGNPGGLSFSVTQGIVSAVNRGDSSGNKYVQIDVPINPGNSGGPLINTEGEVIGVNTLKLLGFEGVGFAVEADQVKTIVTQIIAAD
jgi:S1-C subfamily serine protease